MLKNLKLWKKRESRVVYFTSGKGLGLWQTFTHEMGRLKAILVCVNSFKSKEVLIWIQLLSRNNKIVLCVILFAFPLRILHKHCVHFILGQL